MNGFNPFDWSGPWFLLAYLIFGVLVYYLARELLIRQELRNPHAKLSLADDPYRIAFLRGGALEAVKIAAIVLVDRGLLRADGPLLETASADSLRFANHDIERDVLRLYLGRQGHSRELAEQADMLPSCRAYLDSLKWQELLVGPRLLRRRQRITGAARYLLLTVAAVKAVIAISRQHYNLLFLALLLVIFLLMLRGLRTQATSWSAQRLLTDLRMLFGRLNMRSSRLNPGSSSADMALLAAIFGLGALPLSVYAYVAELFPVPRQNTGGDSSSSSSGDSSSGGGDGGGDGGGSSGGCGGCGGGGGCGS
ncbi:TIGR04222 domain-containing membrane protein [Janthinobacterium sp. EB271-G4-7A]|uniref:TIGR04222 domain-containing membrane protein n=1 Tax=Janthinobacterium sp. EB271-G4-7A TaxID=2775056 RepID=UPI001E457F1F|nr:TIGR04222 domain-containing membrane protein [Janthinobacterium sp. EB271-G4-7A]MCC7696930.1 TIGR04222 domain-containing membrane protein [Janthinobacterium sp. EB271-G4-7A]